MRLEAESLLSLPGKHGNKDSAQFLRTPDPAQNTKELYIQNGWITILGKACAHLAPGQFIDRITEFK